VVLGPDVRHRHRHVVLVVLVVHVRQARHGLVGQARVQKDRDFGQAGTAGGFQPRVVGVSEADPALPIPDCGLRNLTPITGLYAGERPVTPSCAAGVSTCHA
jgi:hypothetical protein